LVNKKVPGSFNLALRSFVIVAMWSSVGRGGAARLAGLQRTGGESRPRKGPAMKGSSPRGESRSQRRWGRHRRWGLAAAGSGARGSSAPVSWLAMLDDVWLRRLQRGHGTDQVKFVDGGDQRGRSFAATHQWQPAEGEKLARELERRLLWAATAWRRGQDFVMRHRPQTSSCPIPVAHRCRCSSVDWGDVAACWRRSQSG
jgi:hypothetical protein